MKKTNLEDIKYLYEGISLEQHDFLNEESEYFDEEIVEIIEELTYSISFNMLHEGYSANGILNFLSKSSDEDIIEYYLNPPLISENLVPQEHIDEQAEIIFEKLGLLRGLANIFAKRAPALKSAGPLTQKAATRLAMQGKPTLSSKAKVGLQRLIGPKGRKAIDSVKTAASGAIKRIPGIAKAAGLVGLGALGGYAGAKLGGAGRDGGKGSPEGSKTSPEDKSKWNAAAALGGQAAFKAGGGAAKMKQNPEMTAADVQKIGMQNLRKVGNVASPASATPSAPSAPAAPSGGAGRGGGKPSSTPAKPKEKPEDKGPAGETPMQKWARLHPNLASKVKIGQSGYEEISSTREKPGPGEKKDQIPTQGPPEAKINPKEVEASIKAEQERQKKKSEQTATTKESYDAYDIILEYLMSTEQAETLDEAHYLMIEMDENAIGNIMKAYDNHLLSEEIQEWVNDLLDEGYDLSEYSWDDIVEYYVTEWKNLGK